jgi:Nif-specific regulatory protein
MAEVFALTERIASCDVTALVTGETGTGKELLARAIHDRSARASGPFVAFSCANLPETLIDDELFGHERGAFTGADGQRRGRFEAANGGTLFLDEIGDLPLALQARLLRVLQQRTFERLGGSTTVSVNVRLICATHRDLETMVKEGKFREDLLYRLNVIQLRMPALRDRREDIPALARYFVGQFASKFGQRVTQISTQALAALVGHRWPGNVRELENVIQRAVALAESETVQLDHLPEAVLGAKAARPTVQLTYDESVRDFKRRLLARTLRDCEGNKTRTALALNMARPYLHRLLTELDLTEFAAGVRKEMQLAAV